MSHGKHYFDALAQLIRKTKKFIEEEDDIRHKRIQRILRDLPGDSEGTGSLGSHRSDHYSDIDSDIESHVSQGSGCPVSDIDLGFIESGITSPR